MTMSVDIFNNVNDVFESERRQFYSTLFDDEPDEFVPVSDLDIVVKDVDCMAEGVIDIDTPIRPRFFNTYKDFLDFMVSLKPDQSDYTLGIFSSSVEPFIFHDLDELHDWFYNKYLPYVKANDLHAHDIVLTICKGSTFDVFHSVFKYVFFGDFRLEAFIMMLVKYQLSKEK